MLIDTHAHLWFDDFSIDLEMVIERARKAGVEKMIVPGTDMISSRKAIELARKYPGIIYACVGVHPEEVLNHKSSEHSPIATQGSELWGQAVAVEETPLGVRELVAGNREQIVAIGEIGTDASTDELKNCMDQQIILFREQCELALEYDLPVIIHTRNSLNEALEVLDQLPKMPRGQFHCFSHDEIGIEQVLSRGFYVSFCGNITWSKRVAKLVNLVPSDRLLLETDSPLMVPRDKKGEPVQWAKSSDHSPISAQGSELGEPGSNRNEPANVRILAEKIAEIRGQTLLEVDKFTTENVNTLFKL